MHKGVTMTENVRKAAGEFIDGILGGTQAETDMKNAAEVEKETANEEKENSNMLAMLSANAQTITEERENMPAHDNDRGR